jgi:uncharacterized repeat protein (TIGR01451 family)
MTATFSSVPRGWVAALPILFVFLLGLGAPAAAQDLNVYMTASSEVVGPGDRTTYMLTATNTGPTDLTSVSVEVNLPANIVRFSDLPLPGFGCAGTTCDANERATWTVGTLAPGQSQSVMYRVQIASGASAGPITSSATASATGATDAQDALDVEIDDSPLVRLSVAPESGPAVAGEEFTYTLSFGNIGSASPSNVVLSMPIPEGTTFVSATGGGTESGRIATWNLGTLGVGNSGQIQMTVEVDASRSDGQTLEARAELNPNASTEPVARSSVVTAVRANVPLRMEYAVSQTALGPGETVDVTLTAANTSPVDLTDVSAQVLLPGNIARFSDFPLPGFGCAGTTCEANERATWAIGTLAPGQSRTVFFRAFVAGSAPQGEVLRSLLVGSSTSTGQVTAAQDLHVDPSPLLRLSLAPESGPAAAGEEFTYTLTVGNVGSANPTNVALSLPIPEGTSFVSATDGSELINEVVHWDIGSLLSVERAGQAQLTIRPSNNTEDGHLLAIRATLDSGSSTEVVVRSSAVTPVRTNLPLQMEYTSDQIVIAPSDPFSYTLSAVNTSTVDLTDVSAQVLLPGNIARFSDSPLPDFGCAGTTCEANEWATWAIGTLAPGQEKSVTIETSVQGSAPRGIVLRSLALATATGSDQVILQRDVFVASNDTPLPVELTSFTASLEGEAVALAWSTATETNNAGFDVERSTDGETFTAIGFEPGVGTTEEAQSYRFVDRDAPFATTLFYRLRQVDTDGTFEYSPVVEVEVTPSAVALLPVAPNPVVGFANLRYELPEATAVRLQVFDLLGRRVATLADGEKPAGRHEVTWTGSRLAPGTYFVRLQAGSTAQTQMLRLVR